MNLKKRIITTTLSALMLLTPVQALNTNDIEHYDDIVYYAEYYADRYDIPKELVMGVIEIESTFDHKADSGNCKGLMQINKVNQKWLNSEFGRKMDLLSIKDNIAAGSYILAGYYHKYDLHYALMCYNGGKGYANKMKNKGITSTRYSRDVINATQDYKEE
jgi:soluble lytic murein transglycosylase-like protein